MTRDDIIRMAIGSGMLAPQYRDHIDQLERFAAIVAAAEREACAQMVDPTDEHRKDARWGYLGGEECVELLDITAATIRARSIT